MHKITIKLSVKNKAKRLETFLYWVNLFEKPNVKKNVIIEEDRQIAFLTSPDKIVEITAES